MPPAGLGSDSAVCVTAFIESMRAQVLADNPGDPDAAKNLDLPQVQKNFAPLGEAVYRIATAHAQTVSDAGADAAFWAWVGATNSWMASLSKWQQGVTTAFTAWAAATPAEKALRAAVIAVPAPGAPPAGAPARIRGQIV